MDAGHGEETVELEDGREAGPRWAQLEEEVCGLWRQKADILGTVVQISTSNLFMRCAARLVFEKE